VLLLSLGLCERQALVQMTMVPHADLADRSSGGSVAAPG
jgi:hypothetical protein